MRLPASALHSRILSPPVKRGSLRLTNSASSNTIRSLSLQKPDDMGEHDSCLRAPPSDRTPIPPPQDSRRSHAATNTLEDFQSAPLRATGMPTTETSAIDEKKGPDAVDAQFVGAAEDVYEDEALRPSEEDMLTLRKVSAPLP